MSSESISNLFVFVGSFLVFSVFTAPDNTWINTDSDGSIYIAAAKYLRLSHPTGAPLYNLLNWALYRITPGETDYWRIAIWSAVFSSGTATILWMTTRRMEAVLVFLTSGLVISQSSIIDTYALITLLMTIAYYFHKRNQPTLAYITCGLGAAVHHLIALVFIPLILSDYFNHRLSWKSLYVFIGLPFYLYVPLLNRAPYHWIAGNQLTDYMQYFFGQGGLIFGLAIIPPDDLLMRLYDTGVVLVGGLGIATVFIVKNIQKTVWRRIEIWLFLLPIVYYSTSLPPQAYVYMLPSIVFGCILAVERLVLNRLYQRFLYLGFGLLFLFNLQVYDVGATLDEDRSATAFYEALNNLPSNAVVYTGTHGWEVVTVWLYQYDTGRNVSTLNRPWSKTDVDNQVSLLETAAANNVLYRTVLTDPSVYGVRVEQWNASQQDICRIRTDILARYFGIHSTYVGC